MRIIGLYGHGNCGKSHTLNYLKELLREAGKSISSQPHPDCEDPETFEYKGLIVCVAPGGDDRARLEDNIRYFKSKHCDVAISATRSKGGSVEALQEYEQSEGTTIEWKPKSYEYCLDEETQTLCNKEYAQVLFDMI